MRLSFYVVDILALVQIFFILLFCVHELVGEVFNFNMFIIFDSVSDDFN